ncbi:replication initiator protein A [Weissella cibaria]|uniref:replication initiator protein A n=1 Tax=Weissella cibaria TaxID=137591 RepID=UPI001681B783|nr:replication initiator protein A [Weissella cibaria]MBD1502924.1 replication initiator protein A [Weissella cibaria]
MNRISASEANGQRFFQSPKAFIYDDFYKPMSVHAKYLYGILRDRFELSFKNDWVDDDGFIYIYCTLDDIRDILAVGKTKAIQIKRELQEYDLLEEVQQGINKPNRLYVGQVVFHKVEASNDAEVQNMNPNDTEFNETELTNTELPKLGLLSDEDDEITDNHARETQQKITSNDAMVVKINQLISDERWIQSTHVWTYLFDWEIENPSGTFELVNAIVDAYWNLRRAKDEGYSRVGALGVEAALDMSFDNAKKVADQRVVDSKKYFTYLSQGITMLLC